MYANTDSTTYAQFNNTRNSTSNTYYCYVRGFNFNDVPSAAIVSSFTIKIKASETNLSTSSNYRMSLYNGTTSISNTTVTSSLSTTATVFTFPNGSLTWDTLKGYGANFGIRVPARRANTNSSSYAWIYGAEIEVTYTLPDPRTITSSLTGNGTINPSGAQTYYDGDTYTLTITPTNTSDTVTATKNGTDITNDLVPHYAGSTASAVLGTYSLISGSYYSSSYATYFSGLTGKGYDATQTTTNYYSSSSGSQVVFQYAISLTVPSNATITRLYMMANGHAESTSNSDEYMCVQLVSGNTALSAEYNFKNAGSTSNSTQTIEATTLPTLSQLSSLAVKCKLGYYGGALNGVTVFVEYSTGATDPEYYTYSYTVSGNATIAVTIGGSSTTKKIYVKENNSWNQYSKVYVKTNGVWVEQSNSSWSTLFDTNTRYLKGN